MMSMNSFMNLLSGGWGGQPAVVNREEAMTADEARQAIIEGVDSETIRAQAIARLDRRIARGEQPGEALFPVMAWAEENDC